jgi:integrase
MSHMAIYDDKRPKSGTSKHRERPKSGTVKWERDTMSGVYWRMGARGRKLFRHTYRNTERQQVACSKHQTITATRNHQREMLVTKPEPVTKATLREAYERIVADAQYAESTLDVHRAAWKHIAHLADMPAGKITSTAVSDALKAVPGTEMRAKVRYLLTTLGASVPVERKPKTRAKRMQKAPKPLRTITAEELARLVAEMPERYRALVEVMAYQGLRPGEAVSLRVGDLDAMRRTLKVERSLSGFTKTGIARTLTLPSSVAELLVAHIARFSPDTGEIAPMFTTESGHPIATKNAYDAWARRHFTPAVGRADIRTDLSPNDLRHYAVKFAIGHGADVFAVQKMLGHAKPSITLDVYGAEWESHAEELAERMDAPIRAARAKRPVSGRVVSLTS